MSACKCGACLRIYYCQFYCNYKIVQQVIALRRSPFATRNLLRPNREFREFNGDCASARGPTVHLAAHLAILWLIGNCAVTMRTNSCRRIIVSLYSAATAKLFVFSHIVHVCMFDHPWHRKRRRHRRQPISIEAPSQFHQRQPIVRTCALRAHPQRSRPLFAQRNKL